VNFHGKFMLSTSSQVGGLALLFFLHRPFQPRKAETVKHTSLKFSLMTIATSALALTALTAPAHATDAGDDDYAATVPTSIAINVVKPAPKGLTIEASITSTDTGIVSDLHGTATILVKNPRTGRYKIDQDVAVSGASGVTVSASRAKLGNSVAGKSYVVKVFFEAADGHFESGSAKSLTFTY
jgi:hypothetical protein